jgi:hypothetical protein
MVNNPTDGGVVLFGSPGTLVENNTIWVVNVGYDFSLSNSHENLPSG